MKIGVVGTGYVGLVTGVCLADFGLNVMCMDVDEKKIETIEKGQTPIYEPGLEVLLEKNIKEERLRVTTDMKRCVEESDVIFIAVGTPPKEDGSADLKYVLDVAGEIGRYMDGYKVIVDKSTVPVGTGKRVEKTIKKELEKRGAEWSFDVVSNPEFLREGKALHDFSHPDRVVIGTRTEKAKEIMKEVYRVLYLNKTPFVFTDIETAEMIKYASNAFLAVKISFINEMALLAEKVGANVQDIASAMGMDGRISPKFLHAGPGYGGSCFPKDTKALVDIARKEDIDLYVVKAAIKANERQKMRMVEKIEKAMKDLEGKEIAVLGLTFKPDTDDMREAPSLTIIPELIKRGARIKAFCPKGFKEAGWRLEEWKEKITYCRDEYEAVDHSHAVVLIT
ncbi:MAG TPA: UDP-glucose/GDP-mannose dehydrogenase family protein, partial [Candidatus Aminicenantes bacterium]|nr:UDP-glucose/GDP-mannose dehydrogenase family protein [Candidatus Aminicenantes bacterium]